MGAKDWVTRAPVTTDSGRLIEHVIVDRKETLLWLANRTKAFRPVTSPSISSSPIWMVMVGATSWPLISLLEC
jgi:hypothetical protein